MFSLDGIVGRAADAYPDRVAIIDDDVSWTWAELDRQVTRTADALRALGGGPGTRIAAAAHNSAEYFALYFGAARLQAVLCPLNYMSAGDELRYLFGDFEPQLLLAAEDLEDALAAASRAAGLGTEPIGWARAGSEWAERLAAADPEARFPEVDSDALHLVMYTSGTTGRPKGVCHTQRAHYVDGLMAANGFGITRDDRYLVHAPSFHCACWDHAKMYLVGDASVRLLPRFEAGAALEAISRDRVTSLFGVPAVLRALLNHPRWRESDTSSLRTILYGGALGEIDVLFEMSEEVGHDVALAQVYGLTEAGPFVAVLHPDMAPRKPVAIGRPIPGVEMRLADPVTNEWVTGEEVGEIVVRAPSIMEGYWRNPEATRDAIRDGWLHTGDLARRDADGDFHVVDRLKDMIRTGGENVYAAEVERVLMSHPAIVEGAVVGVPDPRWDERVVAVVTPTEGASLTPADVQAFCRERLAAYKVPKQVVFVADMPRTGLGKVAKQVLRRTIAAGEGSAAMPISP